MSGATILSAARSAAGPGELADALRPGRARIVNTSAHSVTAAFDSAPQAVAAAVELRRSVPSVRVGIASGEVTWEAGRCAGPPVAEAARLRDAAADGEIRIGDAGPPATAPPPARLIGTSPGHPFVGRSAPLAVLDAAWSRCVSAGEVVLVGGEAGTGKTRLAAEFGRTVHDAGAAVVLGSCDADLALPYQPWVQVANEVLAAAHPEEPVDELAPLGVHGPRVDRPRSPAEPDVDPAIARARLYGAFGRVLGAAATRWRTLVVLDDLHWAGPQTLALLTHLARVGLPAGMLVLGTFRDTGDELGEPLARCLADLRRHDTVTRLALEGLDGPAVEHYVAHAVGHPLDADLRELARELGTRSGGNAFYLGELWRHLTGTGAVGPGRGPGRWTVRDRAAAATVPDGVREVVGARLRRLTPAARGMVEMAAVAGQRVDVPIVAAALAVTPDSLDAPLDELLSARLLAPVDPGALVYRFEHALVRETVEATLRPIGRRRAHLALAEALERGHTGDRRWVLTELARHLAAGAPLAPVDKAVRYARLAAAQAARSAAYDEAASHLETALGLGPPAVERTRVLVELATAWLRRGAYAQSRARSREAFDAAAALDDPAARALAAEAALLYEEATHFPGLPGAPAVTLLERAVRLLGEGDAPLQVRLQASLGRALAVEGRGEEAAGLIGAAVQRARAIGDGRALLVGLQAVVSSVTRPGRVLDAARELEELADRSGDLWSTVYGSGNACRARIALGDLTGAAAAVARMRAAAETGRYAMFLHMAAHLDAILALAAGDLAGAERHAERGLGLGEAYDAESGPGVYGVQMFVIRRAQGRLAEVAPVVRLLGRAADPPPVWRPGLAALHAELGMVDEARALLDALALGGFAEVPRDAMWPACLAFLGEACVLTGAREHAQALAAELEPSAGTNLTAAFTMSFGPADRLRAGLAELVGRPAEADACFRSALALAERSRSPLWAAEVLADRATVLAGRGDTAGADGCRARATELADAIGVARRAPDVPAHEEGPAGLSQREREVLDHVATGLSNRRIAERLFISEHTVANHVRAILRKTGTANRTEAAALARRP